MLKIVNQLFDQIIINGIGKSTLIPAPMRYHIYRFAGLNISKSAIRSGCVFDGGRNIEIKEGVFINKNTFINCLEKVIIREKTFIAFDVLIVTDTHIIGETYKRAGKNEPLPVDIGKGCWIGARATILPGVKIGDGCVIAAGSVVHRNCEPNGLYAGVPAKRIRDLS